MREDREKAPAIARDIAVRAHGDQRYGDEPYCVHLDAVANLVAARGPFAQALAYLHDSFEDTTVNREEIGRALGERMVRCIALLTDEPDGSRMERKATANAKLRAICAEDELVVLVVKAADRLCNVRASLAAGMSGKLAMYRREHAEFRAAAFRPGLADTIWSELDASLEGGAYCGVEQGW